VLGKFMPEQCVRLNRALRVDTLISPTLFPTSGFDATEWILHKEEFDAVRAY
jgi:hypothetical protein